MTRKIYIRRFKKYDDDDEILEYDESTDVGYEIIEEERERGIRCEMDATREIDYERTIEAVIPWHLRRR